MPRDCFNLLRPVLLIVLIVPLNGHTQPPVPEASPDARRGRQVVIDRDCIDCHGDRGQGDAAEGYPRLAGQSRVYLYKQLQDFAIGNRPSEDMQEVVAELSDRQMADVAAYFAELAETPYPTQPSADPADLQTGGRLSAIGAPEREIQACALCHADFGAGLPPSFPYLAGQHAGYTARQLQLWKQDRRGNDPLDVMARIAKALTDEEISALGVYFARVRLSPDAINDLTPSEP